MSLPKTYRQLEYIETTGTQYVDTGVTVKNNTSFIIECAPTATNQDYKIFGAYNSSQKGAALGTLNSKWRLGSNWGNNTVSCSLNKTTIVGSGTTWTIDNNSVTVPEGITAANINMYVGCANYGNTVVSSSCKIWSLMIYEGDTKVRDYIPVQRKSDGVLGLYDLVNDVFYTNSGTGNFTAGPVTDENEYELPSTFKQLEYIQSSGTQYIQDTLIFNDIAQVDIRFQENSGVATGVDDGLFGTSTASWSYNDPIVFVNTLSFYCYTQQSATQITDGSVNDVEIGKTSFTLNGVTKSTTVNSNSGYLQYFKAATKYGNYKIYYIKVYDSNYKLRDFVPVQRKSDSVLGLYDLENGVFYTNDGTGDFIAGPILVRNINKVIYNNNVLIDLTGDTVTAETLASGSTAHGADGDLITGIMVEATPIDIATSAGMTAVLVAANVGKCYRFTGTTDANYTNGDLYVVEEDV